MPKRAVSVTLDEDNLLWLRGQMTRRKRRSLSDALDEVVTAARAGGAIEDRRSVVGTIGIRLDDPGLEQADAYVRSLVGQSLSRPLHVHEEVAAYSATPRRGATRSSKVRTRPARG